MPVETELAWLAGLWDGEGSIAIFERKEPNRKIKYCPTVVLTNCDVNIINEAMRLTNEMDISLHVFQRKPEKLHHTPSYQLTTRNVGYIRTLLTAILPYLVGKRSRAEMMLRYIDKRAEYGLTAGAGRTVDRDGGLQALGDDLMAGITAQNAVRLDRAQHSSECSTTIRQAPLW